MSLVVGNASSPKNPVYTEVPNQERTAKERKRGKPSSFFEQLMKHDAHRKVSGRFRQTRWGR